jgi:hypothetical protein
MERKLAVVYPWASPFIWTACVDSMLNLRHPKETTVRYFRGAGWCSASRHLRGCQAAVEWGADYIVIVGSDQVYEPDMLERLMARVDEGYEVLAAMVPARCYVGWQEMRPFQPMAWRFKTTEQLGSIAMRPYRGMMVDADMVEVVEPDPDQPMQRIHFIGSGVLLFATDLLTSLQMPWFYETFNPETMERIASMDTKFVWRLQFEALADLWLDTSIEVKHIHPFEIDHTYQYRFADWATHSGPVDICNYLPPTTRETQP